MDKFLEAVTEYLPVTGVVVGALIVALVAVFRKVAEKKGPENTKLDEVADKLEDIGAKVADLTDGHPDLDPDNGK